MWPAGPGGVRPLLAGVAGQGAHRRRRPRYLWPIAAGRIRGVKLPQPVQRRLDDFNLLITGGFLPQRFRDEMRLDWDADKQRRFDRLMKPHSVRQRPAAARSSGSSRSTDAEGSRLADPDRPPARLVSHARARRSSASLSESTAYNRHLCVPITTPGTSPRASARRRCSSPRRGRWRRTSRTRWSSIRTRRSSAAPSAASGPTCSTARRRRTS